MLKKTVFTFFIGHLKINQNIIKMVEFRLKAFFTRSKRKNCLIK